jgi:hypothetical protein
MDYDKKWFYLSTAMTSLFAGYIISDLYIKYNKKSYAR